ncbi:hypothetical protein Q5P01_021810 [Channa striata]|uniref:Uncharacterized protein n=1 Tax=Channa striata TaxID=64152 RepID=A0AA88LUU4_CHASR|nr:hypothetical protein Q5P01_021810 [Channa striata]
MERRGPIHHSLAPWSSHCHSTETLSNKDGMKAEACHAQAALAIAQTSDSANPPEPISMNGISTSASITHQQINSSCTASSKDSTRKASSTQSPREKLATIFEAKNSHGKMQQARDNQNPHPYAGLLARRAAC